MIYVGIDYHKKYSQVEAMDEEGKTVARAKLANGENILKRWFSSLPGSCEVVIEACWNWQMMYEILESMDEVERVYVANPYKVRAIAEARIKTDTIDASTLAHLLRANLIPSVYIPSEGTRKKKEVLRQRMFLVRMATRVKNRLHALIERYRVAMPSLSDPFGKTGLSYLKDLRLPPPGGFLLRQDIELLEALSVLIKEAEKEVSNLFSGDEGYEIARSLPGLGLILSGVVVAEIDRIDRFPTPSKLLSYAGLVPTTYASGGRIYHGHLIKTSNKWLRWAMVEASWTAQRCSPYCQTYYRRHLHKGHNTAVCILARRLLEILWVCLRERRCYEERVAAFSYSPLPSQNYSRQGSRQV